MRSVAVLGHSNELVHAGYLFLKMLGRLGDAALGDGRTPGGSVMVLKTRPSSCTGILLSAMTVSDLIAFS